MKMEGLQYDSFYKFIVSIGTVLIVAPIIGLHYLVSGSYDIVLSKKEFNDLSDISMELISNKKELVIIVFNTLPFIFGLLILLGLLFIIIGGHKWYKIQKNIDKSLELDVQEKEFNYKKMTSSEILEKALIENTNLNSGEYNSINVVEESTDNSTDYIRKALRIEDACFNYVERKLSNKYVVRQNIKVGDIGFDIIATSKSDNVDYLYEIKYCRNLGSLRNMLKRTIRQVCRAGSVYKKNTKRNYRMIIMVVTNSENIDEFKKYVKCAIKEEKNESININDIEVIDERILTR